MSLKIDTRDIFQSDVTSWGETVGMERVASDEITIWLSGHKATFTPDEAEALRSALRAMISMNMPKWKRNQRNGSQVRKSQSDGAVG